MAGYSAYHSTGSSDGENDFKRLSNVVISNIQKISQSVNSMKMMVNQLGTSQDTDSLRTELHKIQHYTNQLAKDTNKYMKQMQLIQLPSNSIEQKQRKMQRERLAADFSDSLSALQETQKLVAQKEKDSIERTRADTGIRSKYSRSDDHYNNHGGQLIQLESPIQNQMSVQLEEEANLEMLRDREQAIRQIENDIVEVNMIFKDLAVMVHEQGSLIDSIEANIESASVQVEHGTQQLEQAKKHQNASRRKLCIIVVIALIILAIIITIIVLSVKN